MIWILLLGAVFLVATDQLALSLVEVLARYYAHKLSKK